MATGCSYVNVIFSFNKERNDMANLQPAYDADRPKTITAIGLRWSALRGMLGSPLIDTDEQRPLREELLQELQSVERSMSQIAARHSIELCAKIDVLREELKKAAGDEDNPSEKLLVSIRKDVSALVPRNVGERSTVQIVRGVAPVRAGETAAAEVGVSPATRQPGLSP
jgi:hypothetical protein